MELRKYYAGQLTEYPREHTTACVYIESEADAAFAAEISEIKQQHAEEIERLKDEMHSMEADHFQHIGEAAAEYTSNLNELRKQAERYEKLRKLNVGQFQDLFIANIAGKGRFDALVDQLPASGEKP